MMGKGIFRRLLSLFLAVVFVASPANTAFALSESQLDMYAQNNILFYDPNESPACDPATINGSQVTVIGDSISVGARGEYNLQIPGSDFDAKTFDGTTYNLTEISKHFSADAGRNYSGLTIAKVLQEQGVLRPYVVFALGTNDAGAVTDAVVDQLMNLIGTNHNVVFVTNYAVENQFDYSVNNAAFNSAAERYNNVEVADWAKEVAKDPSKYIGDGSVHPTAEGNKLFVKLIKNALDKMASGEASGVSTGNNRNYAGATVWSEAELKAIEANAAIYQEAANKFGFPWQVMAVLHSHETSLRRYNPDNGQGVYQLYTYTAGGTNANRFEPADSISEEEFRRQTLIAAEIVSGMVGDLNDPNNVKKLFFSYNGRAQKYIDKAIAMGFSEEEAQNGEGSAYVMNRYDAQRDPTSDGMSSLWPGRFVKDNVYDPNSTSNGFGAFVQYEAIAGSSYCLSRGGTIVETAIAISWEGRRTHDKNDPKPEYVEAMQEVELYITPCNDSGCAPKGASCDFFVSTVMRFSGADPEFPGWGPGTQMNYMAGSDKYEEVDVSSKDASVLQPGDIFVYSGHIFIHLGDINGDGQMWQGSASFNDRTGEHYSYTPYWGEAGKEPYRVFRRIN